MVSFLSVLDLRSAFVFWVSVLYGRLSHSWSFLLVQLLTVTQQQQPQGLTAVADVAVVVVVVVVAVVELEIAVADVGGELALAHLVAGWAGVVVAGVD